MKDPNLFVEEVHLGGNLWNENVLFNPTNSSVAVTSNTRTIVYDVKSGQRRMILPDEERICGLYWLDDTTLITISSIGQINTWNLNDVVLNSQHELSSKFTVQWVYNVGAALFAVAISSKQVDEQVLLRIDINTGKTTVLAKLPIKVHERRKLAFSDKYAAFCDGKTVRLLPFDNVTINGELEYTFSKAFTLDNEDKIVFSSVTIVEDHVFAVLALGRVYYWKCVSKNGFNSAAKSFFHAHPAEVCIAVTPLLSVFCGSADCRVDRWSLQTSGAGRYQQKEGIERMDAPVELLWLSADANYLMVVLADNSMVILNASLAVVSRPHTMQWPSNVKPLDWLGLYVDNSNPEYVVTNTRIGFIQWMDPVKWRTVSEFDVVGENIPPRDSPNLPNFNWSNVYAINTSTSLLVTAERRRDEAEMSAIRFYHRVKPGCMNDMRLMDVIRVQQRIRFIRCSLEDARHTAARNIFSRQYVVIIDDVGQITTYEFDPNRQDKWRVDLKRVVDWQKTKIVDCSSIRLNTMATVNIIPSASSHSSVALIWNTEMGALSGFVDQIPNVRQVRWAPSQEHQNLTLLISGEEMFASYDFVRNEFLWAVTEPRLNLFANLFVVVAYRDNLAFVINHKDGTVTHELKFSSPQNKVVATGSLSNVRLSGLNSKALSLLKPDTDENSTLRDITSLTKTTPFSVLAKQARSDATPASSNLSNQLSTVRMLSARKLLEGSAHTLAPLDVLASTFIRSCLIPRQVPT
ncbi:hypothetical protein M3Y94_00499900 [Aphelenchoides besseyi]|nr:hypothetical protein M3Y94_00499900 [Aphelenchoides besseyi]KAI6217296.1 hypothetical protein M3Y95_01226700 [Aphelenchoides besseyi]